jgi:hypothetical protein
VTAATGPAAAGRSAEAAKPEGVSAVRRKPSEPTTAKERSKAEQELREAALAYGLALEHRDRQASAPAVKREDAQESVDGAAERLLTAARGYFVASQGA